MKAVSAGGGGEGGVPRYRGSLLPELTPSQRRDHAVQLARRIGALTYAAQRTSDRRDVGEMARADLAEAIRRGQEANEIAVQSGYSPSTAELDQIAQAADALKESIRSVQSGEEVR
ncbi:hypothetical protein ACIBCO_09935 [Streptomyces violascens]|uniref:hypothetical protein n=1 Tax=Streptomyces violascens TaxID=67381 RepID=UPI0037B1C638